MFRMPGEWEPHERTLIGWPCRPSSWRGTLDRGRAEFAAVANALSAFEPVTMICANEADAATARKVLSDAVEIAVFPMDGSWLRDNGPIFVTDGSRREARHFRFNAWGERHAERDRDAALGANLAAYLGDPCTAVDIVLEGGAIAVDGAGRLVAAEGCVMHPTRNWNRTRDQVETALRDSLGIDDIVWLPEGLNEDLERDPENMHYGTDGHIDLFFDFISPGRCLLLAVDDRDPNAENLAQSRATLEAAGIEVVGFPYLSHFEEGGRRFIASYLNFYLCNGGVLIPVADAEPDKDEEAVAAIAACFPDREAVAIPMRAGPMQGGAIHCLTQQVPRVPSEPRAGGRQ